MAHSRKRLWMQEYSRFVLYDMYFKPLFAATNNFSKTTVKLNAINGGNSRESSVTSGSISGDNPAITKVELYCNVSTGTDPYMIYVKSPSGTTNSMTGPTKSGNIIMTGFEEENPSGTWTIWIRNSGISYNGNIYPASTVTVTLKVSYSY